jgi:hypothetical protein
MALSGGRNIPDTGLDFNIFLVLPEENQTKSFPSFISIY